MATVSRIGDSPAPPQPRVVAAIYCRISLAAMGDTTKVEDQERQCRDICERYGWEVGEVFTDNSRSAWRRDRKRPDWDAMLEGLRTRRFGAVASYWGDRIVRQPRDLEDLLDIREVCQITFASVQGQYDFDNPDHRMMMRWEVARACNESDTISRRKKAGFERLRLAGRAPVPGGLGGRSFGFERDGMTPVPAEKQAADEAADRILAGETAASICRDFATRGITATTGRPLHYSNLRKILLRPRSAGLLADGTPGIWEPLITPAKQKKVRAVLAMRTPSRPITTADDVYMLTGIARCGFCRNTVRSSWTGPKGRGVKGYGCLSKGCFKVRRNAAHLDAYVTGRVLRLLNSVDFTEEIRQAQSTDPHALEIADWERRHEGAKLNLDDADENDEPETVAKLRAIVRASKKRLDEARTKAAVSQRKATLAAHQGITLEQWRALPLRVRRDIISSAYTITIGKAAQRGPGFDAESIDMKLRED